MQIITFKVDKKGMNFHGELSWETLRKTYTTKADMRFCLYDYVDRVVYNKAIFIDIDNVTLLTGINLMSSVEEIFGEFKIYQVFTGNGFHFYIPFDETFTGDKIRNYSSDYKDKCHKLFKLTGHECDLEVFKSQKYGRVPNSVNSKNGKIVRFIKENSFKRAKGIGDVLKWRPYTPHKGIKLIKKSEPTEVEKTPIYQNCGFIKYCHINAKDLNHELWNKAMCILGKAQEKTLAHHISKDNENYDPREVEAYFQKDKDYVVMCETIAGMMSVQAENPCVKCPHNRKGNCPSFISGSLPTPSASNGYHGLKKVKSINDEGEEEASYVIDPDVVMTDDVFHKWANDNMERALFLGEISLIRYEGTRWIKLISDTTKWSRTKLAIKKELFTIPLHRIANNRYQEYLLKKFRLTDVFDEVELKDMDNPKYINLKNGVLDVETLKFHDHNKDYLLMGQLDTVYNKEAKCPRWESFLETAIPDVDDRRTLRYFAGLMISNIPTYKYQEYLWLYGASGAGKSMIARVFKEIVGLEKTMSIGATFLESSQKEGFPYDLRGKSLVLFDDLKHSHNAREIKRWESFANTITGGVGSQIRLLYIDSFDMEVKSTLIVTSNEEPLYSHSEGGTLRRVRTIYFYKVPKKQTSSFEEALEAEKEGILQWALAGLADYMKNGKPPLSAEEKHNRREMEESNNDVIPRFLMNAVEWEEGGKVRAKALYNIFVKSVGAVADDISQNKFTKRCINGLAVKFGISRRFIVKRDAHGMTFTNIKIKEREDA